VLTDKDQTITSEKTFNSHIKMGQFSEIRFTRRKSGLEGGYTISTGYDPRPGFPNDTFVIGSWDVDKGEYVVALVVTEKGQCWINAYRGIVALSPQNFNSPIVLDDMPENTHIDKVQIRVDEPFDHDVSLAVSSGDEPHLKADLAEHKTIKLDTVGVTEIPIARHIGEKCKPCIHLESDNPEASKSTKGKAELYFVCR
jgi:hypothetical protein